MLIGLTAAVTNHTLPTALILSPLKAQNPQAHALILRPGLKAGSSERLTPYIVNGNFASRSCVDEVLDLRLYKFTNLKQMQPANHQSCAVLLLTNAVSAGAGVDAPTVSKAYFPEQHHAAG